MANFVHFCKFFPSKKVMLGGRIIEFVSGSEECLNVPPLSIWRRSFSFYGCV